MKEPKGPPPDPQASEDANARLAMKMIRQEIKRLLDKWDPLCLKGLRGFNTEYDKYAPPLGVLVRKGAPAMEICAHLDRLVREEWKLPACPEQCLDIAEKIHRTGTVFGVGKQG